MYSTRCPDCASFPRVENVSHRITCTPSPRLGAARILRCYVVKSSLRSGAGSTSAPGLAPTTRLHLLDGEEDSNRARRAAAPGRRSSSESRRCYPPAQEIVTSPGDFHEEPEFLRVSGGGGGNRTRSTPINQPADGARLFSQGFDSKPLFTVDRVPWSPLLSPRVDPSRGDILETTSVHKQLFPRRSSRTIRIFSSAENFRRVLRRMSRTVFSAEPFWGMGPSSSRSLELS
jgi:hypothetical protein